jgi:hypothetical protein
MPQPQQPYQAMAVASLLSGHWLYLHMRFILSENSAADMQTWMCSRCGRRRTRSRLAARLSALDEDNPDDEDAHTEDEDDEDDEHEDAVALHDDDEDEEDGPVVPLSIPKGDLYASVYAVALCWLRLPPRTA